MADPTRQAREASSWAEPLTENERALIARVIESQDEREITRWMNHVLKCYDGLLAERDALAAQVETLRGLLAEWIAPGTVYEIRKDGQILDLHARTRSALAVSADSPDARPVPDTTKETT